MINSYIDTTLSNIKYSNNLKINEIKTSLYRISYFYDLVKDLRINKIPYLIDYSVPYSENYNNFLSSVEYDLNIIAQMQKEIKNNIIVGWNYNETKTDNIEIIDNLYDDKFNLQNPKCTILNNVIYPKINISSNLINNANVPLVYNRTNHPKVEPFLGKEWGVYNENNINKEDGIRICNLENLFRNNNFYEVEATVLNYKLNNVINFQPLIDSDIKLESSLKFTFNREISANYINLIPLNFASNCYFDITKIEISDSINSYFIPIENNTIFNEFYCLFDIPDHFINKKIKSITFYFTQKNSYNLKYSVAYYKQNNNESWLDITGKHVLNLAKNLHGNLINSINTTIKNAKDWIFNYWLPNIPIQIKPQLQTNMGENGYKVIESKESNRERYAIGVSKILLCMSTFENVSELVTKEMYIDNIYNVIELNMDSEGEVNTYLSFNNGVDWVEINSYKNPISEKIPSKLYINSHLSNKRKENNKYGLNSYVESDTRKVRVKFVLFNKNNIVPKVKNWNLKFSREYGE